MSFEHGHNVALTKLARLRLDVKQGAPPVLLAKAAKLTDRCGALTVCRRWL